MLRFEYWKAAPSAIKALSAASAYLEHCSIDAKLRALIDLRVSQINGCAYCCDMHAHQARAAGESQQRLDCLVAWRETDLFDPREQAALAWAEAVTRLGNEGVAAAVYDQARAQFSETELVDLTTLIATMNAWNRMAISFHRGPARRVT